MSSKKFPISRLSKFYDYVDFNLENEMAREYIEGDLNFTVRPMMFMVNLMLMRLGSTHQKKLK